MTKMTEREMFAYIAELLEGHEDVIEFCEKKMTALDNKAAKAKEKAAERKAAGDELRDRVQAVLTDEWQSIADVVNALGDEDVAEATACDLSAGYFVRWVAADLVLAGDNTERSVDNFTLWADGYAETAYKIKIVEPA